MKTTKLYCTIRLFRVQSALALLAISFLIIALRILNLFSNTPNKIHQTPESTNSNILDRFDIVDRNGLLLARSILAYDFYIQPSKMYDIKTDMQKILGIFPSLQSRYPSLLKTVYRKAKDNKARILIASNILQKAKQEILDKGIVGIHFEEKRKRIYPHSNTASHILGFLSTDGTGVIGIERFFQEHSNERQVVQLSIDINIQAIIRHVVTSTMQKYKAKSATGILMKVNTGEIIAAVSLPDFDPNNAGQYSNHEFFNRFSLGVYELGSVFKIIFAALTAEQKLSWTKHYDTITPVKVHKYTINNFRGNRKIPLMTIPEIIRFSSNIGCARAIEDIPKGSQQKMFAKLGLFSKLPIELYERGTPIFPKVWNAANLITASYGHGIAVSPLHFVAAAAAVIHEGVLIYPTILKVNTEQDIKKGDYIISMSNVYKIRSLLRDVVLNGTGKNVATYKYDIGGKSGTAIQVDKGKYQSQKVINSFFAAVPMQQPQYVFYMTLEEPQDVNNDGHNLTGSTSVAPAISKMIALTGPVLGIADIKGDTKKKGAKESN